MSALPRPQGAMELLREREQRVLGPGGSLWGAQGRALQALQPLEALDLIWSQGWALEGSLASGGGLEDAGKQTGQSRAGERAGALGMRRGKQESLVAEERSR